jgi:hypothetical protein
VGVCSTEFVRLNTRWAAERDAPALQNATYRDQVAGARGTQWLSWLLAMLMVEKLLILIHFPEDYLPTVLGVVAFVFAALVAGAARRSRVAWQWGMAAVAIGIGLQAASGGARLGWEIVSTIRLPGWLVAWTSGAYCVGDAFLVLGFFLIWRAITGKHTTEKALQTRNESQIWPPAPSQSVE